ncbi:MAG: hypothetical protein JNL87_10505 [Burkholderiaceae bacterium]|nr:hypothetical protein [Burkholderiaceae bacterium]
MVAPLHPMLASLWREAATPAQAQAQALAAQAALLRLDSALADLALLADPLASLTAAPMADGSRASDGLGAVLAALGRRPDDGERRDAEPAPAAGLLSAIGAGRGGAEQPAAAGFEAAAPSPSGPMPGLPLSRASDRSALLPAPGSGGSVAAAPAAGGAERAAAAAQAVWQARLDRAGLGGAFVQPLAPPTAARAGAAAAPIGTLPDAVPAAGLAPWPAAAPGATTAAVPGLSRLESLLGRLATLPAAGAASPGQGASGSADADAAAVADRDALARADAAGSAAPSAAPVRSAPGGTLATAFGDLVRAAAGVLPTGQGGSGNAALVGGVGGLRGLAMRAAAAAAAAPSAIGASAAAAASGVPADAAVAAATGAVPAGGDTDGALLEGLARVLRREAERDGIDLGAVRG